MPPVGKRKNSVVTDDQTNKRRARSCSVVITSDLRRIADDRLKLDRATTWTESFRRSSGSTIVGSAPSVAKVTPRRGSKSSDTSSKKPSTSKLSLFKKDEIFKNWKAQNLQRCENCGGEYEDLISHSDECPKKNLVQEKSFRTFEVQSKPEELKCFECGKTFLKKIHLTLHQKIHATMDKKHTTRSRPPPRPTPASNNSCTYCYEHFETMEDLFSHYNACHSYDISADNSIHKCACNRFFPTVFQLNAHKKFCKAEDTTVLIQETNFHDALFQFLGPSDDPNQIMVEENAEIIFSEDPIIKEKDVEEEYESMSHQRPVVEAELESRISSSAVSVSVNGDPDNTNSNLFESEARASPLPSECGSSVRQRRLQQSKSRSEPKYHCPECGKKFYYESFLSFHMKNHEIPEVDVTCEDCKRQFTSRTILDHSLLHKLCNEFKKTDFELEKFSSCAHSQCKSQFSDPLDLYNHISQTHFTKEMLCCEACGLDFKMMEELDKHRLLVHSLSRPTFFLLQNLNEDESLPNPYILFKKADKAWADETKIKKKPKPKPTTSAGTPSGRGRGRGRIREDIPFQDVYTCKFCSKKFDQRHPYLVHLSAHEREEKYKCDLCDKKFLSENLLNAHKERHNDPNYDPEKSRYRTDIPFQDEYTCEYCNKKFDKKQRTMYIIHLKEEQNKCHLCPLKFINNDLLQKHLERHKDPNYVPRVGRAKTIIPRKSMYRCEKCGKKIYKRQQYIQHMNQHKRAEKFTCALCGRVSYTELMYLEHLERHKDPNYDPSKRGTRIREDIPMQDEYTCEKCEKTFTQRQQFISHLSTHERMDKFTCKECGRKFITELLYLDHLNKHTDPSYNPFARGRRREDIPYQDEYTCDQCGKKYKQRNLFISHIAQHKREEKYTCKLCGRKFQQQHYYDQHLKRHEDPNYNPFDLSPGGRRFRADIPIQDEYVCDKCNKVFKQRQLFMGHLSMHAREEKYACSICNKKCVTKFLLDDHMKRHDDPSYVFSPRQRFTPRNNRIGMLSILTCEYCGKTFTRDKRQSYHSHVYQHRAVMLEKFKCHICQSSFGSGYMLQEHIKKHSDPNFKFTPRLRRRLVPDQNPQTYLATNSNDSEKNFECEDCLKLFRSKIVRDIHKQKYCKKVPCKYKCGRCSDRFHNKVTLTRHFQRWHASTELQSESPNDAAAVPEAEPEIELSCRQCSQTFNTELGLNRHVAVYHPTSEIIFKNEPSAESSTHGTNEDHQEELSTEMNGDDWNNDDDDDMPLISNFCETEITEKPNDGEPEVSDPPLPALKVVVPKPKPGTCGCALKKLKYKTQKVCVNQRCPCVVGNRLCGKDCQCGEGCVNSTDRELEQQKKFREGRETMLLEQAQQLSPESFEDTNSLQSAVVRMPPPPPVFIPPPPPVFIPPPPPVVNQSTLRIESSEFISINEQPADESLRQLSFEGYVEGDDDPLCDPFADETPISNPPAVNVFPSPAVKAPTPTSSKSPYRNPENAVSLRTSTSHSPATTPPASASYKPKDPVIQCGSTTVTTSEAKLAKALEEFNQSANLHCPFCKKPFKVMPTFISHLYIHKRFDCTFTCPICTKYFCPITDFVKHLDTHNRGISLHCSKCSSKFKAYADLQKHLKVHHYKPMECGLCQLKFTNSQLMMTHWTKEHPTCQCGLCMVKFFSYDDLTFHMKSLHASYDCSLCSTRTEKLEEFLAHMKDLHGVGRTSSPAPSRVVAPAILNPPKVNIKCNQCGLVFSDLDELNVHLANHLMPKSMQTQQQQQQQQQENVPVIKCSSCPKAFKDLSEFQEHVRSHIMNSFAIASNNALGSGSGSNSNPKTYRINDEMQAQEVLSCPHPSCSRSFESRTPWLRHVRSHRDVIFCSVCYGVFANIGELNQHIKTSTCTIYPCNGCSSNFTHQSGLTQHQQRCQQSFPTVNYLYSGKSTMEIQGSGASSSPVIVASSSLSSQSITSTSPAKNSRSQSHPSNSVVLQHQEIEEITLD